MLSPLKILFDKFKAMFELKFAHRFANKFELVAALFLFFSALLAFIDIVTDIKAGTPIMHLLIELIQVAFTLIIGFYFVKRFVFQNALVGIYKRRLVASRENTVRWKMANSNLKVEFANAVEAQFNEWKLTKSEQEVAWLILKGLANAEIAESRNTKERTTRQQATAIYSKAGVEGRSQLAAFFLEDLMDNVTFSNS